MASHLHPDSRLTGAPQTGETPTIDYLMDLLRKTVEINLEKETETTHGLRVPRGSPQDRTSPPLPGTKFPMLQIIFVTVRPNIKHNKG